MAIAEGRELLKEIRISAADIKSHVTKSVAEELNNIKDDINESETEADEAGADPVDGTEASEEDSTVEQN